MEDRFQACPECGIVQVAVDNQIYDSYRRGLSVGLFWGLLIGCCLTVAFVRVMG